MTKKKSLIVIYLIWKENKSLLTLKLLIISILNCICFKISSIIIIFPIIIDLIFYFSKKETSLRSLLKIFRKIILSKAVILSTLIFVALLISRYEINNNFTFPLFTNIFNKDDVQIMEFSEMLRNYRREDFFFLNIFIPTKISDLGQSLGIFTSFILIYYVFKNIKEFKLKKSSLFFVFTAQLLLLLFFCQGRPDYYSSPLILLFYQIGSHNQLKKNITIKSLIYITIIFQLVISSIFLSFSIFLNFNTAIEYSKNMNLSAYGYKNSRLIDQSLKGNILFYERNTRFYYPTNYIDKDRMDSCIFEFKFNGEKNAKEICLEKYNVTQIVNAWEDISLERKYNCENINSIKATRNILSRSKRSVRYCKKRNLSK